MQPNRALCIAFLSLALGCGKALCQTPVVLWFSIDGGFGTPSSAGDRIASLVGQPLAGQTSQGALRVAGGFLVDSLFQGGTTDVRDAPALPREFALRQNYPNPFNPTTMVVYAMPERSHVVLTVFDLLGREVAVLVDEDQEAGEHSVQFNGRALASGVYFYRMVAGPFSDQRKLMLLK